MTELRSNLDKSTLNRFRQRLSLLSDVDGDLKDDEDETAVETYHMNRDIKNVVIKANPESSKRKEQRRRSKMRHRNDANSARFNEHFLDRGGMLNVQVQKRWGVDGALLKFVIAFNKRDITLEDIIKGFRVHDITIIGRIIVDKVLNQVRIPINLTFRYEMEDPHQRGERNSDLQFSDSCKIHFGL